MTAAATFTDAAVSRRVIGCDVGKKTVTGFDMASGRTTELANHAETLPAFAQGLPPDCLVVCEATGGYEIPLLVACRRGGRAGAP